MIDSGPLEERRPEDEPITILYTALCPFCGKEYQIAEDFDGEPILFHGNRFDTCSVFMELGFDEYLSKVNRSHGRIA